MVVEPELSFDPLTGAHTRALLAALPPVLDRQRAEGHLALLLIDLDHFKSINDAFGHTRGDQVLVEFARRTRGLLRPDDVLVRMGGDEFVVLLPGADHEQARRIADRLLHTIVGELFGGAPRQAPQFDLRAYLAARQEKVEAALDRSLPVIYPEQIYEAMRYSLLAGGKRLRPILCLATCELSGGTIEMAMPTACALEMIHTMSLIHDDLPAMDDDDYRRGKLTNHKVFDEAVAILAGDGLLAYAFEHIAVETQEVPADRLVKVIARLARAVGAAGLVGGQVVDLHCEGVCDVKMETLNFIHAHKTAALLEASVVSGAILAGASESDIQKLTRYSQAIGLAFQIVDDVLDITSTQEELGKSVGKDLRAQKATYPSFWGIDESKKQAQQLVEQAKSDVLGFGDCALPLMAIADFITARTH